MATTAPKTACFICDQQDCPYLPKPVDLKVAQLRKHSWSSPDYIESNPAEYEAYFYDPCQRCDQPTARGSLDRPLCLHCQHLRIQHLFACTAQDERFPSLRLTIGTYRQIQKGRLEACEFCTLICNSLQLLRVSASYLLKLVDHNIEGSEACIQRGQHGLSDEKRLLVVWTPEEIVFEIDLGLAIGSRDTWVSDEFLVDPIRDLSVAGTQISWNVVKDWLFECDSQHHHEKPGITPTIDALPRGFMVIDVETGCIVDAPPDCTYIALSYVWGHLRPGELIATAATLANLRILGSLRKDTLPRTVWDAITACQELGVRYLWVDRLCIVQDSDTQKPDHIRAMDVIYARSWLTICAVGSVDSHTGLWGSLDTPRSLRQGAARIGDITMIHRLPDDRYWRLGHAWWKRAWTYQEYLLSRRTLLVSPWQVTFECDHGAQHEAPTNSYPGRTPEYELRDSSKSRLRKYEDIVEEYNDRELSWQDDIYDAFKGVFKYMYGSADQYIWGLPAMDFDQALIWRVESLTPWYNEDNKPSRRGIPRLTERGVHLATWSWVCRSGRTTLDVCMPTVLASVARWNVWDDDKGLRPVVTDGLVWQDEEDATIHAWAAWFVGCIETPLPRELAGATRWVSLRGELSQKWPNYKDYWRDAFASPKPWICNSLKEVALVKERTGRILLRTTFASLRLGHLDPARNLNLVIRDTSGRAVGEVIHCTLSPTFAKRQAGKDWDFVALSVGSLWPSTDELKEVNSLGQTCDFQPLPQHKE